MSDFQFSRSLQQFAVERMAIQNFICRMEDMGLMDMNKLVDRPYRDAILHKLKTDMRFLETFMQGNKSVCFRNHEHNRKGKVVKCEAYYDEERV